MSTSIEGAATTWRGWAAQGAATATEPTAAEREFLHDFEVAMRFGPAGVEMKALAKASRAAPDAPTEPPPKWSAIAPAPVLVPANALAPTEFSRKDVAHAIRAYQTAAGFNGVG